MAEQGRTVAGGATANRGQLTSHTPKVYNTSYRLSYGEQVNDSHRVNFTSYLGHPSGSGFTANQRPAIYYRASLDHADNPQLGLMLADSFMSQTKRHYQHRIGWNSSGSFPNLLNKPSNSGFYQLNSLPKAVSAVKLKTEQQTVFVPHRLKPAVSQNNVVMGRKGETGFSEGADLQLNTFQEKNSCNIELRQTPNSVMKNDFSSPSFLQGKEAIPGLFSHSSRETGFTRGVIAPLACPTSLLTSPQAKRNAPAEKTIGKKEPTGSLLNAQTYDAFPNTPFDRSHFTTQYKLKFCHCADAAKLRSGHTGAGIISAKKDAGYNHRNMDRFILRG